MVKCAQCKRKFRKRGKTVTWQTPDYIQVTHPRRGIEGFVFVNEANRLIKTYQEIER